MSDPWQEPTARAWVRHVVERTLPMLEASAVALSLVPDTEDLDVKFCVELGAMIMLDKPIIVVALAERQVPEKLRLVADEVVVLEEGVTPEGSRRLATAIERVVNRV